MTENQASSRLSTAQLYQLRKLTTPTVYNGWEQVTKRNAARECFNVEPVIDFTPGIAPAVGYAVTAVIQVSGEGRHNSEKTWQELRAYVARQPGPKILVFQDLDKPRCFGTVWGEIASNMFRALGCVGTIIDGGVRDIDETRSAGFKALARCAAVGHGAPKLIGFGCDVEVFGVKITPGQLIHADQHGFLAIPQEDEARLLDAALFMDASEADLLRAAREISGKTTDQLLSQIDQAIDGFTSKVQDRFKRKGEW